MSEKGEICTGRLKDGTPLTVLQLSPDDDQRDREWLKRQIESGYARLSPRSRRLRFVSPPYHLAPWQLEYLSDLDPARSTIWVARDDRFAEPVGMGLARCMRVAGDPEVAEIALTVLDEYQNKGLGRLFLDVMTAHAAKKGLRLLRGYVLPENAPMLHLFESVGALTPVDEDGLLRVDVPLRNLRSKSDPGQRF